MITRTLTRVLCCCILGGALVGCATSHVNQACETTAAAQEGGEQAQQEVDKNQAAVEQLEKEREQLNAQAIGETEEWEKDARKLADGAHAYIDKLQQDVQKAIKNSETTVGVSVGSGGISPD